MTGFKTIGKFEVSPKQRERFIAGELWQEWSQKYPELFDADDVRIAHNQAHLGYHFYEWLAAILIYHSTGYLSLIEQYQFAEKHKRKRAVMEKLGSPFLNELIAGEHKSYGQLPDLLVYSPDFTDWFFCEVKGGRDKLTHDQKQAFKAVAELSHKSIFLLEFPLTKAQK